MMNQKKEKAMHPHRNWNSSSNRRKYGRMDKKEYDSIKYLIDYSYVKHGTINGIKQEGIPEHLRITVEHFETRNMDEEEIYYNIHMSYDFITSDVQIFPFSKKKYRLQSSKIIIYIPISMKLYIHLKYSAISKIQSYLRFLSSQKKFNRYYIGRKEVHNPHFGSPLSVEIPNEDFLENCAHWIELNKLKLTDEELEFLKETKIGKVLFQRRRSVFNQIPSTKNYDVIIKTES